MNKLPVLKLLITISIYCCVFANGICSNIYGPTWLDLSSLLNSTLERMSLSISLRAGFFCCGALLGAFVYKLIDRGALYPLFILIKGLCVTLIPLYANFSAFLFYSAMIGLVSGAADTSVNVWMLDIWKDKSAPFVQALQFFWSCGFIVSPLISNPFLSNDSKTKAAAKLDQIISTTTTTIAPISERLVVSINDTISSTESSLNNSGVRSVPILNDEDHLLLVKESKLYIPYAIAGSICLIGSISLLVIYCYRKIEQLTNSNKKDNQEKYEQANQIEKKDDEKKNSDEFELNKQLDYTRSRCYLVQILLYICIMTSVFCASEMTTFQFAATFCVKLDLGLSKFTGNLIMTAIATSFAIGRFTGIFCAIKFKPLHILLADWLIIFIGNLTLLLSNYGEQYLWIGAILIGFGYSSFFASIFSYLRERIQVTTFISSLVILASLSGNALGFPVFIGKYLDTMPLMMVYGNIFCAIIMLICFIGLAFLDCKFGIKATIIKRLKEEQGNEMKETINN